MKTASGIILPKKSQQYLSEIRAKIDSRLSDLVAHISKLRLLPQVEYALLSRGKRLRPILVILSAQCVGGDRDKTMPLAIAFELIHTATLIHDDIIDQDEMRRGRQALYRKWSVEDGILAGDAMIALAISLAADFGPEIMKVVSQSALELCEGEYMDIHSSLRSITEEDYFLKIKKKSASLFKNAAYCGALVGGGSCLEIESLSRYGEDLGIAYQLRDDIFDLGDLKRMRTNLSTIHLYRMSDSKSRRQLEAALELLAGSGRSTDQVALVRIQEMLNEAGSTTYCSKKILEYVQKSIDSLALLRDNDYRMCLAQMAQSLILE